MSPMPADPTAAESDVHVSGSRDEIAGLEGRRYKQVLANSLALLDIGDICFDDEAYRAERQSCAVPGSGQTRALLKPIETILSGASRAAREHFLAATTEALRLDAAPVKPTRKPRTVRARPPDGLLTAAEAADKLGCSIKTLNAHIASSALRYVAVGHGKKRMRKMFADVDLNEFIANRTRKDSPCPSTASAARHTGISTFTGEVVDFRGPRRPAPSGKRKR